MAPVDRAGRRPAHPRIADCIRGKRRSRLRGDDPVDGRTNFVEMTRRRAADVASASITLCRVENVADLTANSTPLSPPPPGHSLVPPHRVIPAQAGTSVGGARVRPRWTRPGVARLVLALPTAPAANRGPHLGGDDPVDGRTNFVEMTRRWDGRCRFCVQSRYAALRTWRTFAANSPPSSLPHRVIPAQAGTSVGGARHGPGGPGRASPGSPRTADCTSSKRRSPLSRG